MRLPRSRHALSYIAASPWSPGASSPRARCGDRCRGAAVPRAGRPRPTTARRGLATSSLAEPPRDAATVERPGRVVLAEDDWRGPAQQAAPSWRPVAEARFPQRHGLAFQSQAWPSPEAAQDPQWGLDRALAELARDLAPPAAAHGGSIGGDSRTVLVARGPWRAWLALFHLESLPLAGLVLVDPLPLDHQLYANQMELLLRDTAQAAPGAVDARLFREYAAHWDHWTLRLEPGAVPMLIVSTQVRSVWRKAAQLTADRHGCERYGPVPILELPPPPPQGRGGRGRAAPSLGPEEEVDGASALYDPYTAYVEDVVDTLADWVVDRVL